MVLGFPVACVGGIKILQAKMLPAIDAEILGEFTGLHRYPLL
jgi:hypothetical protein